MPRRTFTFKMDKKEHTALFNSGGFRAMPTLTVDDKTVELTQLPKVGKFPMFNDFTGKLHNHDLLVRVSTNGFTNSYDLAVDGISARTGAKIGPGPVIPAWSWIAFFGCIAVAFMNIDNFVYSLVALVTGFTVIAVASHPTRDIKIKIGVCAACLAVAWAVYFLMR